MTDFHLCHIIPSEKLHGLYGYIEVIQTLEWGLRALGHNVTCSTNWFNLNATNIVFGAQLCAVDILETFPRNTIVYNLEQKRWVTDGRPVPDKEMAAHSYLAENFEIWDYSTAHLPIWQGLAKTNKRIKYIPIGYSPILSRIDRAEEQDIDVLIYGGPSADRVSAFQNVCGLGMRSLFVCGLYGKARDELIARSKVILNVSQYDRTFEIVRVSYLLANNKAVVASLHEGTYVEADMVECIKFTSLENIAYLCQSLIDDADERRRLETVGRQVIARRDIRAILQYALSDG